MMNRDMNQTITKINELHVIKSVEPVVFTEFDQIPWVYLLFYSTFTNPTQNRAVEKTISQSLKSKFSEIKLSKSHTQGAFLVGASQKILGLDIECLNRSVSEKVRRKLHHYFHEKSVKNLSTLELWCAWEALFKCKRAYQKLKLLELIKTNSGWILKGTQQGSPCCIVIIKTQEYLIAACQFL